MKRIVIIGAGMSGMVAAIIAAKLGNKVTILERQEKPGKKIALTGNGKCNLSNTQISEDCYFTDDYARLTEILTAFQTKQYQFWKDIRLFLKQKGTGIYPVTNQASSVVDCLTEACLEYGVRLLVQTKCVSVRKEKEFRITYLDLSKQKECTILADRCILSCGGLAGIYQELSYNGYQISKALGLTHTPCYPALVQTKCLGGLSELAGIRQDAVVSLWIDGEKISEEEGELQFTQLGLSGIAVFQLTLKMGAPLREGSCVILKTDLLPNWSQENLAEYLLSSARKNMKVPLSVLLRGSAHPRLVDYMLNQNSMNGDLPAGNCSEDKLLKLARMYKELPFEIKELNSFKHAQVSTGGVLLENVDSHLMVKSVPGLYITGEMLNVTGKCGGYNLYFAAASGYLAGQNA